MDQIDKSMAGKSKKRQADTPPVDTTHDETAQAETAVQDQPTGERTAEQQSIEPTQTKRPKKPKEPRVSSTDCEARVMKMPDGGFRPAFNAQIAVDTGTMIITGVDALNVRGLCKARAVLLWHALAHNLKRMMALNFAFAA